MNRNGSITLVLRVEKPRQAEEWAVCVREAGLKNRRVRQADGREEEKE